MWPLPGQRVAEQIDLGPTWDGVDKRIDLGVEDSACVRDPRAPASLVKKDDIFMAWCRPDCQDGQGRKQGQRRQQGNEMVGLKFHRARVLQLRHQA